MATAPTHFLFRAAISALESEKVLGRCLEDAPLLKSVLSSGDYAEYEVGAEADISWKSLFRLLLWGWTMATQDNGSRVARPAVKADVLEISFRG